MKIVKALAFTTIAIVIWKAVEVHVPQEWQNCIVFILILVAGAIIMKAK